MTKTIFHVDVNSAFLSWSAVKRLKEDSNALDLRTVPSIVGGDVATRHGIVTARSLPAKKYGIKTAMPVTEALRLCPNLISVPGDYHTYKEYSKAFISILRDYTDIVEQASIDEAFMDVTGTEKLYQTLETSERKFPLSLAYTIKDRIRDELGFTVNVGISSNCLLAKMASDMQKPDKVHTLFSDEIEKKMWQLPIGDLFGCGKATAERLRSLGINTIGSAARADVKFLKGVLGEKAGEYISKSANGHGRDELQVEWADAKSYSNETTTEHDITKDNFDDEAPRIVKWLSESVGKRLRKDGAFGKTVFVSAKTSDFKRHSRQLGLDSSTNSSKKIEECALKLLKEISFEGGKGLLSNGGGYRLIGVGVSNIDHGENRQLTIFDIEEESKASKASKAVEDRAEAEREKRLDKMEELLNRKFGKGAVVRGGKKGLS